MLAELLKTLSETEKDLLLPDRHRKPKPPRDSVPTSLAKYRSKRSRRNKIAKRSRLKNR